MFTRFYHWRLDPTVNQWQCWLSFDGIQMTVIGWITADLIRDTAIDVKRFYIEDLREKMAYSNLILQEVQCTGW